MNKYDAIYKVAVTMPDGAIKEVTMRYMPAMICASFASELGLVVELTEIDSK